MIPKGAGGCCIRPPAAFSGKCSRWMHERGLRREKIGRNRGAGTVDLEEGICNAHVCVFRKKTVSAFVQKEESGRGGENFLALTERLPYTDAYREAPHPQDVAHTRRQMSAAAADIAHSKRQK